VTEVALVATSGGLISEALVQDLRLERVAGDGRFLTEVAGFRSLDGTPPTRTQHDTDVEAAFRTGQALWSAYADELEAGMDVGRLRERLLLPLFELLGFKPVFQRAHLVAGGRAWAITHLGWDAPDAVPLLLTADPDLDHPAPGRKRSAHDELQGFLNAAPQRWGMLANGRVLRLLRDFHHTRTRAYVQFDLAAIFEAGAFPDFRGLYRLCHVSRFLPAEAPEPPPTEPPDEEAEEEREEPGPGPQRAATIPLERLYELSVSAGVAAGKRLQPQVRRAIEELANGVLEANPEVRQRMLAEAVFGRELYRELLTVLYRVLFLLFAEQRGMLRGATDLYDETYALTRLRQLAEQGKVEGRRFDLWEGLKATFAAFSDPDLAAALGVYPYDGQLFDPARTPVLGAARCANRRVLAAIGSLTTLEVDSKVSLHVDYRNLGVEELGTVYESLLDYTLKIAERHESSAARVVEPGQAYLASLSTERADLASYYTPPALVELVLSRSLDPLIEERLAAAGTDPVTREAALLDLRVIDPACGSGAFLVGVIDRIASALARARSTPAEPTDPEVAAARRDVLARCIYGVDKDPFAVELCKVALWIHCAVPDAPLSFLDAHIVCGDSLVGWPLLAVPRHIPTEAFAFGKATGDDKKMLEVARKSNEKDLAGQGQLGRMPPPLLPGELSLPSLLDVPEGSFADVRAKATAYAGYKDSPEYRQRKAAAHLWTAAFFWTAAYGDAPTTSDYHQALVNDADPNLLKQSADIAELVAPLHWPLEFPTIRDRGGFDLVVGNPPWEQFKGQELEFFAEAAPDIAALPSKLRKQAIEQLAERDPSLHARWLQYKAAQDRLAHYAKSCGRYTRTRNEANTYVLFTELAAELTAKHGRVGMLVKSGIAIDAAQCEVWNGLVRHGRVREVRDIVNRMPLFPAIAAVERFTVLTLGPDRDNRTFHASMVNLDMSEAAEKELVPWDPEHLRLVCPATGTLLSARYRWEIDLATHLHERWPTLEFDRVTSPNGRNPWKLAFYTLFHSSGDQELFERREDLEAEGWELQRDRTLRHADSRVALPVFEGQMVNRYDHRARTYEGYAGANKYGRKPHLPWVTEVQHTNPGFEAEPRYWMLADTARDRLTQTIGDRAMVAYRDVAGSTLTNSRSMKAALLFPGPATHKLPVLAVPHQYVLRLVALLNSTVFDFLVRVHMPGASLTPWVISQCAAPPPEALDSACAELAERLSVTSRKLAEAYSFTLHPWAPTERPHLEAECDARVAHSYGLTRDQYDRLFDHFEVMARVERGRYGEERTRRLCLEAFDRLEQEG
jgi:N-6 DNA Methylase